LKTSTDTDGGVMMAGGGIQTKKPQAKG